MFFVSPTHNQDFSRPGPEVIIFVMLTSAEHEIYLLINVKMQIIFGIITFISRIND